MPQMMPLNWLTLMFFFIMIFLFFNNLNYFTFFNKMTQSKLYESLKIKMNWKW